jgi:hypothetical protein
VRDPWFPVVVLFVVVLGVWLGIVGPMPGGVAAWLNGWQTLAGALVASIAVGMAFQNTTRSIEHAEKLEKHRRQRKLAAIRAVLSLALSQLTEYSERSAHALRAFAAKCSGNLLPPTIAPHGLAQSPPHEMLKTLADFVEYADDLDIAVIEATIAWIQIFDSRLRGLVERNHDPSGTHLILRNEIEGCIIDAASIYAATSAIYDYARRRAAKLPAAISWDEVRQALGLLGFDETTDPTLWSTVARRQKTTTGPFDTLSL